MEVLTLVLQYAVAPLAVLGWFMFKKQDMRIDNLERRTNDLDRAIAKIETELQYISRDIKDIKSSLDRLIDKN